MTSPTRGVPPRRRMIQSVLGMFSKLEYLVFRLHRQIIRIMHHPLGHGSTPSSRLLVSPDLSDNIFVHVLRLCVSTCELVRVLGKNPKGFQAAGYRIRGGCVGG